MLPSAAKLCYTVILPNRCEENARRERVRPLKIVNREQRTVELMTLH